MKSPLNVPNAALVAALAAVAATAWATSDSYYSSSQPATTAAATATTTTLAPTEPVALKETTTVSEPETAPAPRPAPVAEESVAQPPITVERRRLSEDQRIQSLVMDAILAAPNMTGKIGVESRDAVVTLTGWTNTSGQAYRAGTYAHRVSGVRYVENLIRPRIGGSI